MKAYRALWWSLAVPLGLLGVAGAAVASSVVTAVIVFIMATLTVSSVSVNLQPIDTSSRPAAPGLFSKSLAHGAVGGSTAVCLFGLGYLAGFTGIALVALMTATSPTSVNWWHSRRRPQGPATPGPSKAEPDLPLPPVPSDKPKQLVEAMTNAELCTAWRRSFIDLTAADSPASAASITAHRQLLLDELERRSPADFADWMASGARAASDPTMYLRHRTDAGHHTDEEDDQ